MKNIQMFALVSTFILSSPLPAVCKKCEEVREYNRMHPENNYEYYDDYLKDHAKKQEAAHKDNNEETAGCPLPENLKP